MKRRLLGANCIINPDDVVLLKIETSPLNWSIRELRAYTRGGPSGTLVRLDPTEFALPVEDFDLAEKALLHAAHRLAGELHNPGLKTLNVPMGGWIAELRAEAAERAKKRKDVTRIVRDELRERDEANPPKRSIWPWRR